MADENRVAGGVGPLWLINAAMAVAVLALALPLLRQQTDAVGPPGAAIELSTPPAEVPAPASAAGTGRGGELPRGPLVRVSGQVMSAHAHRVVLRDGANCYSVDLGDEAPSTRPGEPWTVEGVMCGQDPFTLAIRIRAVSKEGSR